ncbi:Kynurenine 3-monooxygenase [Dirofilaria immitis]
MNVNGDKSNCSDDLIRNAQLDVAKELRKQQIEKRRVDTALSFLEEMESDELEEDLPLDEPYEFRGLREVREELDQYTALVQQVMSLARQYRSDCSKHEYVTDNFVEKGRDDCNIHTGLGCHDAVISTASSQNSRMNHLTTIATTTVNVLPKSGDGISKCYSDCSLYIRSKEILDDARQSIPNQRAHSASEPGSLMQLVQPAINTNQKSHPFLSQAGLDSHSLHAAMQTVLGSLKRTLPGFHSTASTILKSNVDDFISAFAVALRRYDDRVRSQIKLLLEKYDSLVSRKRRSELVCEIDHLHKISHSASSKREQLLDILHGPYYQAINCPPLRQMKILHATFSSNSV